MKQSLSLLLGLLLLTLCQAQSGVSLSLDSTSILIGNQATLSISNTSAFPSSDELGQDGIVVLRQWFDTANHTQHSTITCFDEGDHWIRLSSGDSIMLNVRDVANVDTSSVEIRDIATTMDDPYTFWEIFRWILLGLGIALIVAAILYIIIRLSKNKPIIELPKPAPIPPDKKALADLEALRLAQLWQQGKVKEYHTTLTDIVRNYLEVAHNIPSTDLTSDETLEAFANANLPNKAETQGKLEQMLRTADMVKFAKSEPLPYEHDRSMNDAVALINLLTPPSSAV